jgi:RHS repeat-associated protein
MSAAQGKQSVGHPVDVATGAVTTECVDVRIPCRIELTWTRYYSTEQADAASLLGPGWRCEYDAVLTTDLEGYRFVSPEGAEMHFDDPAGEVEAGGVLMDLASYHEVFRRGKDEYVVSRWDVDALTVTNYVFRQRADGQSWPLHRVEDVTGQGTTMGYDAQGRLVEVVESRGGRALQVVYGDGGRAAEVWVKVDAYRRRLVWYTYDAQGRLQAAYDAAGEPATYAYDASSRLVRETLRDGGVYTFQYDDQGRCVHTSGTDGYDAQVLVYYTAEHRTVATDAAGHPWTYQMREDGQVTSITSPLGFTSAFEYDELGRMVACVDANGAAERFEYDARGNRAAIVDPLGFTDAYTFDAARRPTEYTDRAGGTERYAYDALHRLSAAESPAGEVHRYEYNAEGDHVAIVDPLGSVRRFEHNAYGDLVRYTDRNGGTAQFACDPEGQVVGFEDPLGNRWSIDRDTRGNPSRITLPDGGVHHLQHDADGRLRVHLDAAGRRSSVHYAPGDRPTVEDLPDGAAVRYHWSLVPERLEGVTNEVGEHYAFEYDPDGRLVRERAYDGTELHFEYDSAGWCTAVIEPSGRTTRFERDAAGQLVRKLLPDGRMASYVYDPLGAVVAGSNDVCTVTFERDHAGRIVREESGGRWVESAYDARGNRVLRRSSLGANERYVHDAEGWLVRMRLGAGHEMTCAYDAAGNELERVLDGRLVLRQGFDHDHRPTRQWLGWSETPTALRDRWKPEEVLVDRTIRYDAAGCPSVIADARRGRTSYTYTPREWLAAVERTHGPGERYEFDPAGSVMVVTVPAGPGADAGTPERFRYASGGRLVSRDSVSYEYDADGRTVRRAGGAGPAGAEAWAYGWNSDGLLSSVEDPRGAVWLYAYDPFGRRVSKEGPGETVAFVWDQCVPVHEVRGDAVSTLIFEPEGYRPLLVEEGGEVCLCFNDLAGCPQILAAPERGLVLEMDFSAWGRELNIVRPGPRRFDCSIRFQGQWQDAESGLSYNWFRYYDPERTAYISRDPSGISGDLHLYNYPRNPLARIDPQGLVPLNATGYSVYALYHRGATEPYYIGITNDVTRRGREHRDSGRLRRGGEMRVLHPNVRYSVARGYEQAYIERRGTLTGFPGNEINSFRHSRRDARARAFRRAYNERMGRGRTRRACRR